MRTDAERRGLRATFDGVAELYDHHREVAPAEVFDDLVALARLRPGSRLLEIGCGTGQATRPLAERGFDVTAIELGEGMADRARRNLAAFPAVRVVTSSFEAWDPAGAPFDAVVSFNAFHWIDGDVRFAKTAAVLRDGGHLAVYGSVFVDHEAADPAWHALQEDYVAATGKPEERRHVDSLVDRSAEFAEGGHFRPASSRHYHWQRTYDAERYVGRLRTVSHHAALAEEVREDLFARIRRRIDGAPGGTIALTLAAVLYVAERA